MKKFSSTMKASSRRTSQTRRIIGVASIGIVGVTLWYVVPRVLFAVVSVLVFPITATQTWFLESSSSLPQFLRQRSELLAEMSELEQRLAEQAADTYTLSSLRSENETLRGLLGEDADDRIVTGIIGRPGLLPYDVLVIDKGSTAGIVEGAPVYTRGETILGYVSAVAARHSVVTLITSPEFRTTVYVIGPDIYTSAEGMGGGQLRIGVPQGVPLAVGDLVVVPTATVGIYGEISHIESVPTQPEQYAFVSPQTPIASLRKLVVGRTPLAGTSFEEAQQNVAAAKSSLFVVPVPDDILIDTTSTTTFATSTASTSARETIE